LFNGSFNKNQSTPKNLGLSIIINYPSLNLSTLSRRKLNGSLFESMKTAVSRKQSIKQKRPEFPQGVSKKLF